MVTAGCILVSVPITWVQERLLGLEAGDVLRLHMEEWPCKADVDGGKVKNSIWTNIFRGSISFFLILNSSPIICDNSDSKSNNRRDSRYAN